MLTVITPTTGKPALNDLIASVDGQTIAGKLFHFLLWDNVRDPAARPPADYVGERRLNLVLPAGAGRNGEAPGSALRAVGLMAAMTPWVTFADDDVRWEPGHAEALLRAADGRQWAATLRNVWSPDGEYLGVDRFESVGDDPGRTVPYEMYDNNCMMFRRELGSHAAFIYRETREYNDDRLMYQFLKKYAGTPGKTQAPTIHHTCPDRLVEFFRSNCARD